MRGLQKAKSGVRLSNISHAKQGMVLTIEPMVKAGESTDLLQMIGQLSPEMVKCVLTLNTPLPLPKKVLNINKSLSEGDCG
ncbi:hypothetical protein [Sediminibacillus halophilus]|uniref:Uncharacterized protein n=1 Tax=Sediminibacillus halophilus TaxID=482461 RepID=A0A1G9Z010_9BACI|nr:hypothetical protein [Sediminibacillus halophilus]SDN14131.1 hypothetical protein SAMN05216244_0125 [Sediminibacillus halophilus]